MRERERERERELSKQGKRVAHRRKQGHSQGLSEVKVQLGVELPLVGNAKPTQ